MKLLKVLKVLIVLIVLKVLKVFTVTIFQSYKSLSLQVYNLTIWWPTNPPTNNVKARDPVGSKNME